MKEIKKQFNYISKTAECPSSAWPQSVKIIGLGNVLMGDDAFGPTVVEMFRCRYYCDLNVEILDLGTPGLDLAPYLYCADLVVIVDSVQAEQRFPGNLAIYREAEIGSRSTQLHLTAHDPGFEECLLQLTLAGCSPYELLVLGVVPESCEFGAMLSSPVSSACLAAAETIACLLGDHGIGCSPRPTPLESNLWWLQDVGVDEACKTIEVKNAVV